jgi:oligoribonuclease (3'-5' exoribonuclease)
VTQDGQLKKQLDPMFAGYFDDYYKYSDILKILDEAKRDYPAVKQVVDEFGEKKNREIKYEEIPEIIIELNNRRQEWFQKWFGGETAK